MGFDTNEIKLVKLRKWNFPNRKLNYFSHFQVSDQRTSFIKRFSFGPKFSKSIFKTGNRSILTYLDPSLPILAHLDLSWLILTYLDLFWPFLIYLDLFSPILRNLDLSWPSWPIYTHTLNCNFIVECTYSAKCSFSAKCKVHI